MRVINLIDESTITADPGYDDDNLEGSVNDTAVALAVGGLVQVYDRQMDALLVI